MYVHASLSILSTRACMDGWDTTRMGGTPDTCHVYKFTSNNTNVTLGFLLLIPKVAVKEVSKDPDPDTKVYVYFHGPGPLLGILSTVSVNDLRYEDDANDVVSIITVSAS
uniref:Uncharacterized protein n=1 Tax=Lotharella globosa TaxID=91324 RepID=A0A7S4DTU8_9EUKA